jgi:DNA-binding Lrp family transcriptional regulator
MTQEQIADATGLTPVHVNRILKTLDREGLIRRDRRFVAIPNWAALRQVAGFSEIYLTSTRSRATSPGPSREPDGLNRKNDQAFRRKRACQERAEPERLRGDNSGTARRPSSPSTWRIFPEQQSFVMVSAFFSPAAPILAQPRHAAQRPSAASR